MVEHGADYRFGGFRIESDSGESGGFIDDWTLRDWYVAVPATIAVPTMEATASMPDATVSSAVSAVSTRMEATAAMPAPSFEVGRVVDIGRMESTAAMPNPEVSDGTTFPYIFPFPLA